MENQINGEELYFMIASNQRQEMYGETGIYGFFLCNECVYVGQSKNVFARLNNHLDCFAMSDILGNQKTYKKYKLLKPYIKELEWKVLEVINDEFDLNQAENKWINYYNPIFNLETPNGRKHFYGTQTDIDDFVYGLLSMDDLKMMVSYDIDEEIRNNNKIINLDKKWLNKKLKRRDKKTLWKELRLREKGKLLQWPGVKRYLINCGYIVEDGGDTRKERYSIINKNMDL